MIGVLLAEVANRAIASKVGYAIDLKLGVMAISEDLCHDLCPDFRDTEWADTYRYDRPADGAVAFIYRLPPVW